MSTGKGSDRDSIPPVMHSTNWPSRIPRPRNLSNSKSIDLKLQQPESAFRPPSNRASPSPMPLQMSKHMTEEKPLSETSFVSKSSSKPASNSLHPSRQRSGKSRRTSNSKVKGDDVISRAPEEKAWRWDNVQQIMIIVALPCILHYYLRLLWPSEPSVLAEPAPIPGMTNLLLALATVGILIAAQLGMSFGGSGLDLKAWEEQAKQHGIMMLGGGTAFGFLIGMVVIRYLLLDRRCLQCGNVRYY